MAELDYAIQLQAKNPEKQPNWRRALDLEWQNIRHWLRKRFGTQDSVPALWELCKDWLSAEGGYDREEYLSLPLKQLTELLRDGLPAEVGKGQDPSNREGTPSGKNPAADGCKSKGGPHLARSEHEERKLALERYKYFKRNYKKLGYKRDSYVSAARWMLDNHEDMGFLTVNLPDASDDQAVGGVLGKLIKAYKRTPNPKNLQLHRS